MTTKPYTRADVELVERTIHDVTPPIRDGYVDGRDLLNAEACAVLDALAAAGRLLPAEGDRREEWGIWWHSGDSDGIVLAEAQIGSRERAERRAKERIGEYGITRYTLRRCEHRVWADGTTLIGPWTSAGESA